MVEPRPWHGGCEAPAAASDDASTLCKSGLPFSGLAAAQGHQMAAQALASVWSLGPDSLTRAASLHQKAKARTRTP